MTGCNTLFRAVLDAVPVRLWCTDAQARWLHFNRAWQDFQGDAYQPRVPADPGFALHPDDRGPLGDTFRQRLRDREPVKLEFRLRRGDGDWRWMLCSGRPRTTAAGDHAGFIGSCIDVTDRHEALARQERELAEKTVLTQELHHQVKNSAQVFTSLLRVQATRARDPAAKSALLAAAARSAAMASTHQQVWDDRGAAHFDLVACIHRLLRSRRHPNLALDVDAPAALPMPLPSAIPLSLILHELLDNACRHAYPHGGPGRVTVRAHSHAAAGGPAVVTLSVADDGAGMPPDADAPHAAGVGLTIIRSLARQLGARLEIRRGPGTAVTVTIPTPSETIPPA